MVPVFVSLFLLLVIAAVYSVMVNELLFGAIGLAVVSVLLSILMFVFDSPLAAVFELSVCAGLITVVFASAISLTRRLSPAEATQRAETRWKRFIMLPVIVLIVGVVLWTFHDLLSLASYLPPISPTDVRQILWNTRRFDILGQLALLLVGVLGIVVLFRRLENRSESKND